MNINGLINRTIGCKFEDDIHYRSCDRCVLQDDLLNCCLYRNKDKRIVVQKQNEKRRMDGDMGKGI